MVCFAANQNNQISTSMELETLLAQPRALPSIPEAVAHLMTELDKDDPDIRRIGTLLASDPALTTRALRLANSSFFNLQRQVGSVQEAASIMGLNHVRTMVMAAALGGAFRKVEGVNLEQFWRYSLNTANLSRYLALPIKIDENTAFTAGLIHGIGELVMHVGMPEAMIDLDRSIPMLDLKRARAERGLFGIIRRCDLFKLPIRRHAPQFKRYPIGCRFIADIIEDDFRTAIAIKHQPGRGHQ